MRLVRLLLVAALFLPCFASAQSPPTFEVATIKPTQTSDNSWRLNPTPDGLSGMNITLLHLVRDAYGIYDSKLVIVSPDSPAKGWIDRDRFDLEAKVDTSQLPNGQRLTYRQSADMLRPLLADRFHLKVHHETRTFPVFNLVIAKGGPKLKPSTPEHFHAYGSLHTATGGVENGSTNDIASDVRGAAGRPVIDKTSLTGHYDYDLHYASNPGPDSNEPSVFTALQEQLGLKLVPSTAPLDVLVIDSAEKPSAN